MSEITKEMIDKAIKDCFWRKDVCGVDVCRGMLTPCASVIESGKCDTLIELFGGGDKE